MYEDIPEEEQVGDGRERRITATGAELRQAVEADTDRLAAPVADVAGDHGADELIGLLGPWPRPSWRRTPCRPATTWACPEGSLQGT